MAATWAIGRNPAQGMRRMTAHIFLDSFSPLRGGNSEAACAWQWVGFRRRAAAQLCNSLTKSRRLERFMRYLQSDVNAMYSARCCAGRPELGLLGEVLKIIMGQMVGAVD